jgi:hypothetical protein
MTALMQVQRLLLSFLKIVCRKIAEILLHLHESMMIELTTFETAFSITLCVCAR